MPSRRGAAFCCASAETKLFPKRNRMKIILNFFDHKTEKTTKKVVLFLKKRWKK